MNLDIGPYTLLIPITLTGFALSFVFVPLATMTTSTISRNDMGNATGLFNMLRNIGGSIGIAMATTALDPPRRPPPDIIWPRTSRLIGRVLAAEIRADRCLSPPSSAWPSARPGSFGLIYGLMQQQAALLAYVDVFRWTAVLALVCAACTWMFKKPAPARRTATRRPLKY